MMCTTQACIIILSEYIRSIKVKGSAQKYIYFFFAHHLENIPFNSIALST